MVRFKAWFIPNQKGSLSTILLIVLIQALVVGSLWQTVPMAFAPTPEAIALAWWNLMVHGDFGLEILASLRLCLEATLLTVAIGLLISYASVLPFFRPAVALVSKLRFNGVVGLTFYFYMLTQTPHELKLALLVFTMVTWFVTMMVEEIQNIPKAEYELARTLGFPEWRVVWEVVIVGRKDRVFEVLRQIAAISWVMLTTVEGLVKSEGGIGVVLMLKNRNLQLDEIFAIQITIVVIGISLDWLFGAIRRDLFPYAFLTSEKGA